MAAKRILFVEQNTDGTVGGSYYSMLAMIKGLDRERFAPAAMFYREHGLAGEFERHCPVHYLSLPQPVDLTGRGAGETVLPGPVPRLLQRSANLIKCVIPSIIIKSRFIRKHRIDLVHLNNSAGQGYDWIAACHMAGRKCITHNRGRTRLGRAGRLMVHKFDRVISISHFLEDEMRSQGVRTDRRFIVVHNGIEPADILSRISGSKEETRNGMSVPAGAPVIGIAGNIKRWKGQDTVIAAAALLKDKYPELRCLVIGEISSERKDDRDYYGELTALARETGLGEDVIFTGYRRDIPDIINSLDVLVHASVEPEPFGRVIIEAMTIGTPVIASALGGPMEIIENGRSGFLVPPGNAEKLAEAAGRLLSDRERAASISEAARRRIDERFLIERNIRRIEEIYSELLG